MTSTMWERRRARWALYKEAQAAAKDAPYVTAADFAQAHREHVEARGRDFVEDTKHRRDE